MGVDGSIVVRTLNPNHPSAPACLDYGGVFAAAASAAVIMVPAFKAFIQFPAPAGLFAAKERPDPSE